MDTGNGAVCACICSLASIVVCNCEPWWVLVAVSDPWLRDAGGYGQGFVAVTNIYQGLS